MFFCWFQALVDGYAAHLSNLMSFDSVGQPHGNLRLSVRKAGFSFSVHPATSSDNSRKNQVRKTASLPTHRQQLSVCGPSIAVTDEGTERDIDVWAPIRTALDVAADGSCREISSADFDSRLLFGSVLCACYMRWLRRCQRLCVFSRCYLFICDSAFQLLKLRVN